MEVQTSGGITQARQRRGYEPMKELFAEVAVPVAEEETAGAFLGPWRLMAIDGFEWDAPDTPENAAAFGFAGSGADDAGSRHTRRCGWSRSASALRMRWRTRRWAVWRARAPGSSRWPAALRRLDDGWLLIADRNFFNWADWCSAADSGAQLLWRVKSDLTRPVLDLA